MLIKLWSKSFLLIICYLFYFIFSHTYSCFYLSFCFVFDSIYPLILILNSSKMDYEVSFVTTKQHYQYFPVWDILFVGLVLGFYSIGGMLFLGFVGCQSFLGWLVGQLVGWFSQLVGWVLATVVSTSAFLVYFYQWRGLQ